MDTDLRTAEENVEASLETAGVLAPITNEEDSTTELKAMLGRGVEVVSNLDAILGDFFNEYRQLIVSLGLGFGSIIASDPFGYVRSDGLGAVVFLGTTLNNFTPHVREMLSSNGVQQDGDLSAVSASTGGLTAGARAG